MACTLPHSDRRRAPYRDGRPLAAALAAGFGCWWVLLTGFAAPVAQLQQRLVDIDAQRAHLERQERALTARQDELSALIKQLKTEARTRSGPFTVRKIEMALEELRALLVDMETLERQLAAIADDRDDARARLRSAVRDEIHRLMAEAPVSDDPTTRTSIRTLLDAYPLAPDLPALPATRRWPALSAHAGPDAITERTMLVRNERERHDVVLRHIEYVQQLLQEEQSLYDSLADPSIVSATRRQELTRRIKEAGAQIAASRKTMRALDHIVHQLETRLSHIGSSR